MLGGGRITFRQPFFAHSFLTMAAPHSRILQRSTSASHARVFASAAELSSHPPKLRCVLSANNKANSRARRYHYPRPQLVIFDKDGTLICFHSLWVPWVRSFAEKLEEAGVVGIAPKVYHALGFCPILKKVKRGLLAEGTMRQIRDRITQLLVQHGLDSNKSISVVEKAIKGTSEIPFAERTVRQLHDLEELFARLKELGIKIAICTADSRMGTMRVLNALKVEQMVDLVVCGDDKGSMPKPHPDNALFICRQLEVDPKDAMVIGDTPADLGMGRSAKLGSIIGVLSGIGEHKELAEADHLVEHVGELLPLIG